MGDLRWADVAAAFRADGSLRDIVVFGTDLADWQRALDALRRWPLSYTVDGVAAPVPEAVEALLDPGAARVLGVDLGGVVVNCHGFDEGEIEMDLDPREVRGQAALDLVAGFMAVLGRAVGRDVVLTDEGERAGALLRFDLAGDRVRLG